MDLANMMGKIKDMQSKMEEAQASLVHITAEAEAGAGLVKVQVNGQKKLIKLEIDPDLAKPDDLEMLQDLVIAATNKALEDVHEKCQTHMQKQTESFIPNIPGLDLGSLK